MANAFTLAPNLFWSAGELCFTGEVLRQLAGADYWRPCMGDQLRRFRLHALRFGQMLTDDAWKRLRDVHEWPIELAGQSHECYCDALQTLVEGIGRRVLLRPSAANPWLDEFDAEALAESLQGGEWEGPFDRLALLTTREIEKAGFETDCEADPAEQLGPMLCERLKAIRAAGPAGVPVRKLKALLAKQKRPHSDEAVYRAVENLGQRMRKLSIPGNLLLDSGRYFVR